MPTVTNDNQTRYRIRYNQKGEIGSRVFTARDLRDASAIAGATLPEGARLVSFVMVSPPGSRRGPDHTVKIGLSDAQDERARRAATAAGLSLGAFCRRAVLAACGGE